jgi:hypothetical protein
MQESVKHIERIARDKAYKQEFISHRKDKLGRSLSAEHLYQVRKEHLRYQQPFTKPTSFTTEDVTDIYKPFVLENYKRKIAIELERRRRQRQCIVGIHSSSIHTSETDLEKKSSRKDFNIVQPPIVVQTKEIIMGRARRTLTDDGSCDIVHHVGISSPPIIYSDLERSLSQTRLKLTGTIHDQYDMSHLTTFHPPDFIDRQQMRLRQERDHNEEVLQNALRASKQVFSK